MELKIMIAKDNQFVCMDGDKKFCLIKGKPYLVVSNPDSVEVAIVQKMIRDAPIEYFVDPPIPEYANG